jgi:hypothetical protein
MKKIILSVFISAAFMACKKDDEVKPEIPEVKNPTVSCGERKICFDIEDSSYTSNVGMYHLDDTSYFAKYESNGKQLSIDWFTQDPMVGSFPAGNVKMKGKSRIYWFPDASSTYWMSDSGEVNITKHEGNKVSATFNGRLQKLVNGSPNGEVLFVKNGVFTDGSYF